MKRIPKMKPTYINKSANIQRLADWELRDQFGVKPYQQAKKCPKCGTNNKRRRADGVCFACCINDNEPTERYGERDPNEDVLAMNAETLALIQAAGIKPRTDRREPEVSVHEFYTVPRGGLSSLREVV